MNRYSHVIFSSYGNDSVALIYWASSHRGIAHHIDPREVAVVFSNTGWAAEWWMGRVAKAEKWAQSLGFSTWRTVSEGMEGAVRRKKGWPCQQFQWCTSELKINPAKAWLRERDPGGDAICMAGIRRAESRNRAQWPEWVEDSDKHEGRTAWFPLVRHTDAMRDALLARTPFEPLPHRSMECAPCVNANRADLRLLRAERIAEIERIEADVKYPMFRAARHGGEEGIRGVIEWAKSPRGKHVKGQIALFEVGCDSGFCGS